MCLEAGKEFHDRVDEEVRNALGKPVLMPSLILSAIRLRCAMGNETMRQHANAE
jgi:hypothetical protein